MSAWMYSMMWPMWNLPLAYGSAVVTNIGRALMVRDKWLKSDRF
jgi:hypothetical protein